tara:strand:+ start:194 stop:1366 length:1173 start_codon:yes stop_codon:yes gene_type:complete
MGGEELEVGNEYGDNSGWSQAAKIISPIFMGTVGLNMLISRIQEIIRSIPRQHQLWRGNTMIYFTFADNNATNVFWFQYNMSSLGQSSLFKKSTTSRTYARVGLLKNVNRMNENLNDDQIEYCKKNIKHFDKVPSNYKRNCLLPTTGVQIKTQITVQFDMTQTKEERRYQLLFLPFNQLKKYRRWSVRERKRKHIKMPSSSPPRGWQWRIERGMKAFPSLQELNWFDRFMFIMRGGKLEQVYKKEQIAKIWSTKNPGFNKNMRDTNEKLKLYERVIYEESGYDEEKKCRVDFKDKTITTNIWFDILPIKSELGKGRIDGYAIKTAKCYYHPHQFNTDYYKIMHKVWNMALEKFQERLCSGPLVFKKDEFCESIKIKKFNIVDKTETYNLM